MGPGLRRGLMRGGVLISRDRSARKEPPLCPPALAAMTPSGEGRAPSGGWDPPYESAALARRYADRHIHLAPDRAGGVELAVGLWRGQPVQPRRRGHRRFSLSRNRAGVAPDPVVPAEFRRYRHLAGAPDPAPAVSAAPAHLRPCPEPPLMRGF